jgi:hypothetical protein
MTALILRTHGVCPKERDEACFKVFDSIDWIIISLAIRRMYFVTIAMDLL